MKALSASSAGTRMSVQSIGRSLGSFLRFSFCHAESRDTGPLFLNGKGGDAQPIQELTLDPPDDFGLILDDDNPALVVLLVTQALIQHTFVR